MAEDKPEEKPTEKAVKEEKPTEAPQCARMFLVVRCDQLPGHCFAEHLTAVTSILLF
jgi:hypothetical protein